MSSVTGQRPSSGAKFHVPTRQLGYAYISKFLASVHLGRLFLQEPADECLRNVIFDPGTVREKAWIVFVNYMLLAMVCMEPNRSDEADRLRVNVHAALNDFAIFLSPSVVNIQTLATLAIHGEDFASPTQSWMLVGYACRQAEALSLHHPARDDSDEEQRRLCLFWLLFLIDKGCALAFGRLPALLSSTYHNTPYPQYQYLARNCPHLGEPGNGSAQAPGSDFGAKFYIRGFELAILIGSVLETSTVGEGASDKHRLRAQIDDWHGSTNAELSSAISAEASRTTAAQQREMRLGIQSFKFQYLQLLIVLLRGDAAHAALRIASAREALSMLPEIVSNWGSVYNGVVWQLLYLPFGPFFAIFGNILTDPTAWTAERDLQLLQTAVSYFDSMCEQLKLLSALASKLSHTAGVFLHFARHKVNVAAPRAAALMPAGDGWADLDLDSVEKFLQWLPSNLSSRMVHDAPAARDGQGRSELPPTQDQELDDMFDWFSWDAYYFDASV